MYRLRAKYKSQIKDHKIGRLGVVIGRDPACDIRLDHPAVSKKHARIEIEIERLWITDLNSATGTYVNGEKIEQTNEIEPGDRIRIGDHNFLVIAESVLDRFEDAMTADDAFRSTGSERRFPPAYGDIPPGAEERTEFMDPYKLEKIAERQALALPKGPAMKIRNSRRYELPVAIDQDEMTVGRTVDCALVLDDPMVSAVHCRLVRRKGRVYVYDENSRNGTYVNAEQVRGIVLNNGDLILVGSTVLEFADPSAPATKMDRGAVERAMRRIVLQHKKTPSGWKKWMDRIARWRRS